MAHIQAVIFDLDDTLHSERLFAFSGFEAVARAFENRLGDPAVTMGKMRRLFDTPDRRRVFNRILRDLGLLEDKQLLEVMIDVYRTHKPSISLHVDADTALDRLRGTCRLGLIADGYLAMQSSKVEALGLRDRIDEIILTDQWGRRFWKPHPRAFEEVSSRLGVGGDQCVYVSDNPAKDFIAPRELEWLTVQVRRSDGVYRDEPPAPNGHPHHLITSLDDLDDLLTADRR